MVAWLGMQASDRADLRQWSTLPASIQELRFWVAPGEYQLDLQGLDASGSATPDQKEKIPIKARAGGTTFYFWRPLR